MGFSWQYHPGNPEYERYIHSPSWRELAKKRMDADQGKCLVCGHKATEVHHLTYDRFGNEALDDLVSLCSQCHRKAEEIYDAKVLPWAMETQMGQGFNFMVALRMDADRLAPYVLDYLLEVRGQDFVSLMNLRKRDNTRFGYWHALHQAVRALCYKRYSLTCAEDRRSIMLEAISNHLIAILLAQIEHDVRNSIQSRLHAIVLSEYEELHKWVSVAQKLHVTPSVVQKLRKDDGSSFGPTLRETILYYSGLDAAAGIRPVPNIACLTDADYAQLNAAADYMRLVRTAETEEVQCET